MNRSRLVVIGAGGHGRVVADIAVKSGKYSRIVFLDDSVKKNEKVSVSGKVGDFVSYLADSEFVVAIGNNKTRESIQRRLSTEGAKFATLVHPSASIGDNVRIGCGTVVMAGAVINSFAEIGDGAIINTCSSVDHDCVVGDYTHISVGAHVAGTVEIGQRVFVCAGVTVINNISICDDCVIGAGAVVVKSIGKSGKYIGIPTRMENEK